MYPLYNFKRFQLFSLILVQIQGIIRQCTEYMNDNSLYFLTELFPFENFSMSLNNFETLRDVFRKLGTNVKHHQTMCRDLIDNMQR